MLERIHLAIVREVDRHGTMTAAADALCLSQSALSHSMKKLEQTLGTAIWLREGRRLRLTQAGGFLLEAAEHVLPQLEHAESTLRAYARGSRGSLRVGMECHPCYQWLLNVMSRYMPRWPEVDVDVKQKFRFGGIDALLDHDIDLLVTPDPERRAGLQFEPVFDFEQVLVVASAHPLAKAAYVEPGQLADEVLITYPLSRGRLDVYTHFLTPAGINPRVHKLIESTDLMLQLVAAGRGVSALPRWLVEERSGQMAIAPVRLGRNGVQKKIHLGFRSVDQSSEYLCAFIDIARRKQGQ